MLVVRSFVDVSSRSSCNEQTRMSTGTSLRRPTPLALAFSSGSVDWRKLKGAAQNPLRVGLRRLPLRISIFPKGVPLRKRARLTQRALYHLPRYLRQARHSLTPTAPFSVTLVEAVTARMTTRGTRFPTTATVLALVNGSLLFYRQCRSTLLCGSKSRRRVCSKKTNSFRRNPYELQLLPDRCMRRRDKPKPMPGLPSQMYHLSRFMA